MDLKIEQGNQVMGPTGVPETVDGLGEMLQNAGMRIALRRGEFPYGRGLGSGFWQWDPAAEHSLERAAALANEALLEVPGVQAVSARKTTDGVVFTISTPLGEGEVTVWKATTAS